MGTDLKEKVVPGGCQDPGEVENGKLLLNRYSNSVLQDEKVLDIHRDDICTTL